MGLPQHPSEPQPAGGASSSGISNRASELPPAAVELATKLFDFARQGKTAELAQYLGAGIPPNLMNHKADSLLMLAAYHGHADTVSMLVNAGADVNSLNDRGQSPLAGAVFKGSDEVVRVLYEEGKADIYAGQPNAVDSAVMFRKENYLALFGVQE